MVIKPGPEYPPNLEQKIPPNKSDPPPKLQDSTKEDCIKLRASSQEDCLNVVFFGPPGHGRSSSANLLLGGNYFDVSHDGETKSMAFETRSSPFDKMDLNILDCPGVRGKLEETEVQEKCNEFMQQIQNAFPLGTHAVYLVLKFGNRFFEEDELPLMLLIKMYGEEFLKKHGVCAITNGDMFKKVMEKSSSPITLDEWSRQQTGVLEKLFKAFDYRCSLFDNMNENLEEKKMEAQKVVNQVVIIWSQSRISAPSNYVAATVIESGPRAGHQQTTQLDPEPLQKKEVDLTFTVENLRKNLPASSMKQESISLLLIGPQGSGKSSTANSILGSKFVLTGCGPNAKMGTAQFGNYELNVIECSRLRGNPSSVAELLTVCSNIMSKILRMSPKGIHAPVFVLKFEAKAKSPNVPFEFSVLKHMFGLEFLKTHGICLVTKGDEFAKALGDSDELTFMNWCQQLDGVLKEIFEAFNYRCFLFNNKETDGDKKQKQGQDFISCVKRQWPEPEIVSVNPGMLARADVHLVVEVASSKNDYHSQVEFTTGYIQDYENNESEVEINVLVVGEKEHRSFHLNEFVSHQEMIGALKESPYLGPCSGTQKAIMLAQQLVESSKATHSDVKQLTIVISEGQSQDEEAVVAEATKLKELGTKVMVVGVKCTNQRYLEKIASDPDDVYVVSGYGEPIKKLNNKLQKETSTYAAAFPSTADILFLIDSSGSIGEEDYQKELNFVVAVVECFNIGRDDVQFAAMTFSREIIILFDFNSGNHEDIKKAILEATYQEGGTPTAWALKAAREHFARRQDDRRSGSKKIVIVITDGGSDNFLETCQEAQLLQDAEVVALAIGVGNANQQELENIASLPEDVYYVDNFDVLKTIKDEIAGKTSKLEKAKREGRQRVCGEAYSKDEEELSSDDDEEPYPEDDEDPYPEDNNEWQDDAETGDEMCGSG